MTILGINDNNNFYVAIDDWLGNNNENPPILYSGRLYKTGSSFKVFIRDMDKIIPNNYLRNKKIKNDFPIDAFIDLIKEKTPNKFFSFQRSKSAIEKTKEIKDNVSEFISNLNSFYKKNNSPNFSFKNYYNIGRPENNALIVLFQMIIDYVSKNIMNYKTFQICFICDRMSWQTNLDFINNKGSVIIADIENKFIGSRYQQRIFKYRKNEKTTIMDLHYELQKINLNVDSEEFNTSLNEALHKLLEEEIKTNDHLTYKYINYFLEEFNNGNSILLPINKQ